MPTYYDEAGHPVAVVQPAYEADDTQEGADYAGLLSLLTTGAADAETIGKRTALLAYIMQPPDRRGTLEDLGRLLGVSRQAAFKRLTRFKAELPAICKESGFVG